MTFHKFPNLLLTLPITFAAACGPDVSVSEIVDMAASPSDEGTSKGPKMATLSFVSCSQTTSYSQTVSLPSTTLSWSGAGAKSNCQSNNTNNLDLTYSCSVAKTEELKNVLKEPQVYILVDETYWLPTVIAGNSGNAATVMVTQGEMIIETKNSVNFQQIGDTRSSAFVIAATAKKRTTSRRVAASLVNTALDNTIVNVIFKIPFACLNSGSTPPLDDSPIWNVNSIQISSAPILP